LHHGEPGAADKLAEAVYDDLRRMARGHLARDVGSDLAGLTIQPTMLATDALMKLIRQRQRFDSAGHFFAIASRVMVRVLLDYHRTRKAQKRGRGRAVHVSLEPHHGDELPSQPRASNIDNDIDIEAFSTALDRLAELDSPKADVVRYRILWGLTVPQISSTLDIATSTVDRDWTFAKAWLARELQQQGSS
jgi:RNA polymerase sigma factor (TIGR02999 family)